MNLEVKDESLSNHQEFEVTAGSLRDNLTTLIKNSKSKARQEIANTSLAGENASKNEGSFENLIERWSRCSKKTAWHQKPKIKGQEMTVKVMERFEEPRKRKWQYSSETGSEAVGFLWEKLNLDCEFKSEDLQRKSREKEVWERQHNQLLIRNQKMQAQVAKTTSSDRIVALLLQNLESSVFQVNYARFRFQVNRNVTVHASLLNSLH